MPKESFTPTEMLKAEEKEQNLRRLMREMEAVLVAYSGGVDSTYLAFIANQELNNKALCVMGISPSVAKVQWEEAEKIAVDFNLNYFSIATDELMDPNYRANPNNRCYFCKTELYGKLVTIAKERKIKFILDGANLDDTRDYRPGREAAAESGVRSPLVEVGLAKMEIRQLSRISGLPTWDKPASPCLSSRIAYGVPVSIERLGKVEKGEEFLRGLNFREFRVRNHGELVRLEISPGELPNVLNKKVSDLIADKFRQLGFKYVTLDLHGYRTGSMNEVLKLK